ncbi:MAG TPA: PH domain-containing protein [Candidatus Paceibacterota bacterium]
MEEFELEPGERVIRSIRKHWIIFALRLLPYALLGVLPLALPAVVAALSNAVPAFADIGPNPLWQFALGMWWLFLWIGAFNTFVRYYLDQWVITTTRIVDIHQYGFFNRRVSSFLLDRVQDVTTSVDGFLATMVGFGTLNAETAGRDEQFQMMGVANPEGLRDLIMREVADLRAAGHSDGV